MLKQKPDTIFSINNNDDFGSLFTQFQRLTGVCLLKTTADATISGKCVVLITVPGAISSIYAAHGVKKARKHGPKMLLLNFKIKNHRRRLFPL